MNQLTKRAIGCILATALLASFTACGSSPSESQGESAPTSSEENKAQRSAWEFLPAGLRTGIQTRC